MERLKSEQLGHKCSKNESSRLYARTRTVLQAVEELPRAGIQAVGEQVNVPKPTVHGILQSHSMIRLSLLYTTRA